MMGRDDADAGRGLGGGVVVSHILRVPRYSRYEVGMLRLVSPKEPYGRRR